MIKIDEYEFLQRRLQEIQDDIKSLKEDVEIIKDLK